MSPWLFNICIGEVLERCERDVTEGTWAYLRMLEDENYQCWYTVLVAKSESNARMIIECFECV